MSENQLYLFGLLLGQTMPYFTDTINKYISSSKVRFFISMAISALIAIVLNFQSVIQLKFNNLDQILTLALILWASGQAAYKTYYEGSTIQSKIRYSTKLF